MPFSSWCLPALVFLGFGPVMFAQAPNPTPLPDAPQAATPAPSGKPLKARPEQTPADAAEALRISRLPLINGIPYDQPSTHDLTIYYVHDTYGLNGQAGTAVRALYSEIRGKPEQWGTDFPGFAQRFASAEGVTAINGTVRYGMEVVFHEDLRYLPCVHCSWKHKIENALLAEVTARHGEDGRRFFTLTPTISDFSGPIIAHSLWYPNGFDPFAGVVATRVVAVTRVGIHLGQEYLVERRRKREPR